MKISGYLWLLMLVVASAAQAQYNPKDPPEPSVPVTPPVPVTTYTVTVKRIPDGKGSVSWTSRKFEAGATVSVKASNASSHVFTGWHDCNDVFRTDAAQLSFVMPAADTTVIAHFRYDPGSPSEPDAPTFPAKKYTVTVKRSPENSGSVGWTSRSFEAGAAVSVTAADANGYVFTGWHDCNDAAVSDAAKLDFAMPAADTTVIAHFRYDPGSPSEPGTPTVKRNVLYGLRTTAEPGRTLMYEVLLENTDAITGMSCDLKLSAGLTADMDGATAGLRTAGHSLSVQSTSDSTWHVAVTGNGTLTGNNGALFSIPLTVPADAQPGITYTIGLGNGELYLESGITSAAEPVDGYVQVIAATGVLPDSPDFTVTGITSPEGELNPGDRITVGWQVLNSGTADATGGWTETVTLVDAAGNRAALGTLYCPSTTLARGESISRSADFNIPDLPGLDGAVSVCITVTPDPSCGEIAEYRANNTVTGADSRTTLAKRLVLTVPADITEGTQTALTCRLDRTGSWTADETFSLYKTGDSRLKLPQQVTIQRGRSGAYFIATVDDNNELDDSADFGITAVGDRYAECTRSFTVTDDELPAIVLTLPADSITEGGSCRMTVTLPRPAAADVTVKLAAESTRLTMPATVIIAAGKTEAEVTVTAAENDKIENDADITISAGADRYENGEAFLLVRDNDMPLLALELSATEVSEGAGAYAIRGKLSRSGNTGSRITVVLTDDKAGNLIYDKKIVMDRGVTEYDFNIGVQDNSRVDGTRTATFTAAVYVSSCSCSAAGTSGGSVSRSISIIDNDGPSLSLRLSSATLRKDARGTTLTVSRNTATDEAMTVNLNADPAGLLAIPATIEIAAGKSSASVTVEAPLSAFTGVERVVSLSAEAADFAKGTAVLLVSDRTLPDATVALAGPAEELMPGAPFTVHVTVGNEGNTVMPDAAAVDIFQKGTGEAIATAHTAGRIEAGGTEALAIELTAPKVPGKYSLTARVNNGSAFAELTRTNNASAAVSYTVVSPLSAIIETDRSVCRPDEAITVSGRTRGYGEALELYYITRGTRRSVTVEPAADGSFSTSITPGYAGDYTLGVCIPGENKSETMASFSARGMQVQTGKSLVFDINQGATAKSSLGLTNRSSVPVTGIKAVTEGVPEGCTVSVECPSQLAGNAKGDLVITVSGDRLTEGDDWEKFSLTVSADGLDAVTRPVYYFCRPNKARLVASVSTISTTMTIGGQNTYRLTIGNTGKAATGDITLALPAFMQKGTPATLPSIETGGSVTVDIMLTPTADMKANVAVSGRIGINCAGGDGLSLPYRIEPVSSEKGTLQIDVKDEYTFNTAEAPHVEDADIMVTHPSTGRLIAQGKTGADGIWETELPAGYYTVEVSAQRHTSSRGTIQVAPGTVNYQPVFLSFNAITYSWHVEETTVDDSYEIVTTVEYETRVPKPVVVVDYPKLEYRNQIAYITITNKGLVAAEGISVKAPGNTDYEQFEILGETQIPVLQAGETRRIPLRVSVADENANSGFTKRVQSYTYYADAAGGDDDENEETAKVRRRAEQASEGNTNPCRTVQCTVSVPEYECDPVTGLPVYNGRMTSVAGVYTTGDCGSAKADPHPSGPPGGRPGGDGLSSGGDSGYNPPVIKPGSIQEVHKTFTPSLPLEDDIVTFMKTGCWSDCNKALGSGIASLFGPLGKGASVLGKIASYYIRKGNGGKIGIDEIYDDILSLLPLDKLYDYFPKQMEYYDIFNGAVELVNTSKSCSAQFSRSKAPANGAYGAPGNAEDSKKLINTTALYLDIMKLTMQEHDNILGPGNWSSLSGVDFADMVGYINTHKGADGLIAVDESTLEGKPASVDQATYISFLERYNNTVRYEADGTVSDNMRDPAVTDTIIQRIAEISDEAAAMGYPSLEAFIPAADKIFNDYFEDGGDSSKGICSVITLEFKQTMVMTRQAFRGTLTVTNGHSELAMKNVKLLVKIRDEEGNITGTREFAVSPESKTGFDGELDLNSGWSLGAGATGSATVMFIPSKYAAPVESRQYSFGGVLSYIDPFTGTEVTRELSPVAMTVKPSPILELDYFLQRDVMGDDPLTPNRIEKSTPAEFALVINNKGYGEAKSLKMTTEQPRIVDNRRGLAIDFAIVGSTLNGRPNTMPIGSTVTTEFGDLPADTATWAQWKLRSSLMGHFISYDVSATQLSAYGSEDMSLLDRVAIHELIHGMTVEDTPAGSRAFLVNDISDVNGKPDMLWFSDGSDAATVGESDAADIALSEITATGCVVTVTATVGGWSYGVVDTPWRDKRTVTGVTRLSDGKVLPADNFWITGVTLRNSAAPDYEERLHFAANLVPGSNSYRLTMEQRPDNEPQVVSFGGVPAENEVSLKPVTTVDITFSKPVDPASFGNDDILLTIDGKQADNSGITVKPVADEPAKIRALAEDAAGETTAEGVSRFSVALGDAALRSGHCVLTVDAKGITDMEGQAGTESKQASWTQLADGTITVTATATPAAGGSITPQTAQCWYGKSISMTAEPAEGYEFKQWLNGNDNLGNDRKLEITPLEDMTVTAQFSLKSYDVNFECDENQGTIQGSNSGIYTYGTVLTTTATAAPGFEFAGWENAEGDIVSQSPELTLTVKDNGSYRAVFTQIATGAEIITAGNGVSNIWPVPVRTRLHISGDFRELQSVAITDVKGSHVRIYRGLSAGSSIDVSGLAEGVYLIEICTERGRSSHRFVKL